MKRGRASASGSEIADKFERSLFQPPTSEGKGLRSTAFVEVEWAKSMTPGNRLADFFQGLSPGAHCAPSHSAVAQGRLFPHGERQRLERRAASLPRR